jgi:hypothetical protein
MLDWFHQLPGKQKDQIERYRHGPKSNIKYRSGVPGVRTHQDRAADRGTVEYRLRAEPVNSRSAKKPLYGLKIASASRFVPPHQPKAVPELRHVVQARIYQREPTSGTQHPRRFGEVLRSKDADDEIDSGISHRPFGPQVRNSERQPRPPPRCLPRGLSGNIEAKTGDGRR